MTKQLLHIRVDADDDSNRPSLLFTKLLRSKSVNDVVELADFLCRSLPVVSDVEELNQLEKRLKDVREQGWERGQDTSINLGMHLAVVELWTLPHSMHSILFMVHELYQATGYVIKYVQWRPAICDLTFHER